jgi:hypothetical protein
VDAERVITLLCEGVSIRAISRLTGIHKTTISTMVRSNVASRRKRSSGKPKTDRISTSHMERANLTWRMQLRRFTRLTNAFSKKLVYLQATLAIYMAFYNFCRVHQTLRVTPAMEAGLTDHVWTIRELLTAKTELESAA